MKNWIGLWLIAVSILHTAFAFVVFGDVLASIFESGVFDTVGSDPMLGAVVWFLLFGGVLFILGIAVAALEKSATAPMPRSLGWSLFLLGVLGVVLMPISGFWLAFPPAIAILTKKLGTASAGT